jgi:hypothetical protein
VQQAAQTVPYNLRGVFLERPAFFYLRWDRMLPRRRASGGAGFCNAMHAAPDGGELQLMPVLGSLLGVLVEARVSDDQ